MQRGQEYTRHLNGIEALYLCSRVAYLNRGTNELITVHGEGIVVDNHDILSHARPGDFIIFRRDSHEYQCKKAEAFNALFHPRGHHGIDMFSMKLGRVATYAFGSALDTCIAQIIYDVDGVWSSVRNSNIYWRVK